MAQSSTTERKRLVFLSQYFHPEPGATSELLSEVALELSRRGYATSAIAGQPTYHRRERVPVLMNYGPVAIRRCWSTQFQRHNPVGRILNTATFTLSAFVQLLRLPQGCIVVSVTNPPILNWACAIAGFFKRMRYVALIHDVYPDIAERLHAIREGGVVARLWRHLNFIAYSRADFVVVLGRDMQKHFESSFGEIVKAKLRLIPNWSEDLAATSPARADNPILKSLGLVDRFVVLYSGNFGDFHEIDTILSAAQILKEDRVSFLFIGKGKQLPKIQRTASSEPNVLLLPPQPRALLASSLTACDASIVSLREGLSGLAVPSKLYGVMAAAKAALVVAPADSEAAIEIEECGGGVVTPPGDARALATAIRQLASDPLRAIELGGKGYRSFQRKYTLPAVVSQWAALIEQLGAGC
jgi:colanic acid biosynthesis glycosyl transferase WcaI